MNERFLIVRDLYKREANMFEIKIVEANKEGIKVIYKEKVFVTLVEHMIEKLMKEYNAKRL